MLVREPVDRVLSFYCEKRRNFLRGREARAHFNLLEAGYEPPTGKGPPQAWPQFLTTGRAAACSRFSTTSPSCRLSRGPSPDADLWRGRLRELVDRVFLVGVQDGSGRSSARSPGGWAGAPFAPRSGVNRVRPALSESPPEVRQMILEYNWLDAELHELCRAAQAARTST